MKVIGVVDWTNRDKNGTPIAGVIPLVEKQKGEWRAIDAKEEFRSQGQVFWFAANTAVEGALVQFRAKPNPPGQKDEYQVDAPELLWEVFDFRRFGPPPDVRAALIGGLARISGPVGSVRALILCASDVLIGPVDLTRAHDNTVRLSVSGHPRMPLYTGTSIRPLSLNDHEQRLIRVDESAPSGYVDWDDDATVLKRAIEVSVKVAKQAGRETGQTRKQIEDAASALASAGLGPEAQLSRYRLERALALIQNTDAVTRAAGDIVNLLLAHPALEVQLVTHREEVAKEAQRQVRDELATKFADKLKELKGLTDSVDRKGSELQAIETTLRETEAAVESRVRAALERPANLLGEISVLRPLLGAGGVRAVESNPATPTPVPLTWSCSGESIKDAVSLRRVLTGTARTRGVDPALMLRLHAATVAGLMPVTLGSGALAALLAYADGVCGGRLLIVHVSPSAVHPNDFDAVPGGGLLAAAESARDIDGISLVVLEGANRSPLEASVVPLLQLTEIGLSSLASSRGLRLAASLVSGATTAPVTCQLWSHAVAIWPEPALPAQQPIVRGNVALQSDLFALGDAPTDVIDELVDAWPDCRELRPTLTRFGSALTRLYDDKQRVAEALVNGVILPYVATALTFEEQAQALSKVGDADGSVALILRRLRRSLS